MVNIFSKNDVRYIGRFIPLYFVIFMGLLGLLEKKKKKTERHFLSFSFCLCDCSVTQQLSQ